MKYVRIVCFLFLTFVFFSCTKLDETFRGELEENTSGSITAAQLLTNAYGSLNTFQTGDIWHLQEHTSDEIIAPTRGPDWDDNGAWRALHAHTWDATQAQVNGAFTGLLNGQFAASNVLQFNPSAQQAAEARFIRALTVFAVGDAYDQVPYREDLKDFKKLPTTLSGTAAADFVISELTAIMNDLPDGPAYTANKDAAKFLMAKVYLNKGVYANRASPAFDAADMNQVITLADQITASGKYAITADSYFDNFAPDNNVISKENIFTLLNEPGGTRGGNVRGCWYQVSHYNMNPGGWNGFATLSDFYDKFDANDERIGKNYRYTGALANPSNQHNTGFFIGQRFDDATGVALKDRQGSPLSFTRDVKLTETGANLEVTGIRVVKYPYDYGTSGDQKNNDWALFRYADLLLMKAEAMLRTGNAAGALAVVNSIRTARGVAALSSLSLDNLIDERGREMYWEGWRRQDLIRFGKFLNPWQEKPTDDPRNLVFPIPANQLAVNPNLVQNPGY